MGNTNKPLIHKEAVAKRCSVKKVFLEISQNSQENTCARVPFLINFFFDKDCLTCLFRMCRQSRDPDSAVVELFVRMV